MALQLNYLTSVILSKGWARLIPILICLLSCLASKIRFRISAVTVLHPDLILVHSSIILLKILISTRLIRGVNYNLIKKTRFMRVFLILRVAFKLIHHASLPVHCVRFGKYDKYIHLGVAHSNTADNRDILRTRFQNFLFPTAYLESPEAVPTWNRPQYPPDLNDFQQNNAHLG